MKALAARTQDTPESFDDRSNQDSQPPQEEEEEDQQVSTVSFFLEDEEEPDTIFNLQHPHNTISKGPPLQEPPPTTSSPSKGKYQT